MYDLPEDAWPHPSTQAGKVDDLSEARCATGLAETDSVERAPKIGNRNPLSACLVEHGGTVHDTARLSRGRENIIGQSGGGLKPPMGEAKGYGQEAVARATESPIGVGAAAPLPCFNIVPYHPPCTPYGVIHPSSSSGEAVTRVTEAPIGLEDPPIEDVFDHEESVLVRFEESSAECAAVAAAWRSRSKKYGWVLPKLAPVFLGTLIQRVQAGCLPTPLWDLVLSYAATRVFSHDYGLHKIDGLMAHVYRYGWVEHTLEYATCVGKTGVDCFNQHLHSKPYYCSTLECYEPNCMRLGHVMRAALNGNNGSATNTDDHAARLEIDPYEALWPGDGADPQPLVMKPRVSIFLDDGPRVRTLLVPTPCTRDELYGVVSTYAPIPLAHMLAHNGKPISDASYPLIFSDTDRISITLCLIGGMPGKGTRKKPVTEEQKAKFKAKKASGKKKRVAQLQKQLDFLKTNEAAKAAFPKPIRGKGAYKRGGPIKGKGGYGQEIGGWLGGHAEKFLRNIIGSGDYYTETKMPYPVGENSLMTGIAPPGPVPMMHGDGMSSPLIHREFLFDLHMTTNFTCITVDLDITNPITFPWAHAASSMWEKWQLEGAMLEFVSYSLNAVASDSGAAGAGSVTIAVTNDVYEPAPFSKSELANRSQSVSGKPQTSMIAPIECAAKFDTLGPLKILLPGQIVPDLQFYKKGKVFIVTEGAPNDYPGAGGIFITYALRFFQARLAPSISDGVGCVMQLFEPDATNPFRPDPDHPFRYNTIGAVSVVANNAVVLPINMPLGITLLMVYQDFGDSNTGVVALDFVLEGGLTLVPAFAGSATYADFTHVKMPYASATSTNMIVLGACTYDGTGSIVVPPKITITGAGNFPGLSGGLLILQSVNSLFAVAPALPPPRSIPAYMITRSDDREAQIVRAQHSSVSRRGRVRVADVKEDVTHELTSSSSSSSSAQSSFIFHPARLSSTSPPPRSGKPRFCEWCGLRLNGPRCECGFDNACRTLNGNQGSATNTDDHPQRVQAVMWCDVGLACRLPVHLHEQKKKPSKDIAGKERKNAEQAKKKKHFYECELAYPACTNPDHHHQRRQIDEFVVDDAPPKWVIDQAVQQSVAAAAQPPADDNDWIFPRDGLTDEDHKRMDEFEDMVNAENWMLAKDEAEREMGLVTAFLEVNVADVDYMEEKERVVAGDFKYDAAVIAEYAALELGQIVEEKVGLEPPFGESHSSHEGKALPLSHHQKCTAVITQLKATAYKHRVIKEVSPQRLIIDGSPASFACLASRFPHHYSFYRHWLRTIFVPSRLAEYWAAMERSHNSLRFFDDSKRDGYPCILPGSDIPLSVGPATIGPVSPIVKVECDSIYPDVCLSQPYCAPPTYFVKTSLTVEFKESHPESSVANDPRNRVEVVTLFQSSPHKVTGKWYRKLVDHFLKHTPFVADGEIQIVSENEFYESLDLQNAQQKTYFAGLTRYKRERATGFYRYKGKNHVLLGPNNYDSARMATIFRPLYDWLRSSRSELMKGSPLDAAGCLLESFSKSVRSRITMFKDFDFYNEQDRDIVLDTQAFFEQRAIFEEIRLGLSRPAAKKKMGFLAMGPRRLDVLAEIPTEQAPPERNSRRRTRPLSSTVTSR